MIVSIFGFTNVNRYAKNFYNYAILLVGKFIRSSEIDLSDVNYFEPLK